MRNSFSLMKTCYNEMRQNVPGYISWEMTPTSIGGEKQASISGGSHLPADIASQQECQGILEQMRESIYHLI